MIDSISKRFRKTGARRESLTNVSNCAIFLKCYRLSETFIKIPIACISAFNCVLQFFQDFAFEEILFLLSIIRCFCSIFIDHLWPHLQQRQQITISKSWFLAVPQQFSFNLETHKMLIVYFIDDSVKGEHFQHSDQEGRILNFSFHLNERRKVVRDLNFFYTTFSVMRIVLANLKRKGM